MKVRKTTMLLAVIVLIAAYLGGQFTGYLNRRVAEGSTIGDIRQNQIEYVQDWIHDTNGRWVW